VKVVAEVEGVKVVAEVEAEVEGQMAMTMTVRTE
jgi:hypothetical protein